MHPLEKRQYKDQLYEQFARVGKALANGHRLELLDVLAQGERTVEALASETGLTIANASQHLQMLRAARLVETRRAGVSIHYRLASERVASLWLTLRQVGETHLAEIDQVVETFLHQRHAFHPISPQEVIEGLRAQTLVLLDVRPVSEYQTAHLPRAVSLPLEELEARLAELPQDRRIVAYCRGPYCVFADEAVALLRIRGFDAYRLAEGIVEWRAQALPQEIEGGF